MSIAVVLLCFYLQAKKKRAAYDITTTATQGDNAASAHNAVSLEEDAVEVNRHHDRLPPRYSTVEHPPPYSLVRELTPESATVTGITAHIHN